MKNKIEEYFNGHYHKFYQRYLRDCKNIGGNEYIALCPFHDDKTPSFNFNSESGLYLCRGCGRKGNALHFYAKLNGFDTKRDFPKILQGIARDFGIDIPQEKPRVVAEYNYTDESGNLLFQVVRMQPKNFRQRHKNEKGEWLWNLNGVQRVLYNLPAVIRAGEVLIVEGEKDVETLAAIGFTATTAPGGAGKWLPEYTEHLRGKDVILLPDNDQPGRQHMIEVAAALKGVAQSIKWIDLPDLPSKGDVTDFIKKFNDPGEAAERLSVMIDSCGEYAPPKTVKSLEDAVLESAEFAALQLTGKKMLLSPWLSEQTITLISGWRGVGKSWFALSLLESISRGQDFGQWKCENSVPVLYLDGEMCPEDVQERQAALYFAQDRRSPLYILSDAYCNQLGLPRANLLSEKWRSAMQRVLLSRGVKLWIADNISSLAPGVDENSKKDWDVVNSWLISLRFAGIGTILLHHTNKTGTQRGTSGREDNCDSSIILKQPGDYVPEHGASFITHFTKARVRTQYLNKIKDTTFRLIVGDGNKLEWTCSSAAGETKKEIIRMISDNVPGVEIAKTLNVTASWVSHAKAAAIKAGYLSTAGKLTQQGFIYLHNDDTEVDC